MKLDYKILWLDDNMDEILSDDYPRDIYTYLSEQGFEPILITVKNETEFFENLNDSFDLIMTDFHLNETTTSTRNGDAIIEEVRNKSIFTEIMFYSAQGDVADTIKKDRITFFDTSKVTGNIHYEKIVEKAINLIGLTIKKFQHIVAMRGMIMNETSSLDGEMQNLLLKLIDLKGIENTIPTIKSKYIESNNEVNEEINGITDIETILLKIGATHRWRAIMRNIEKGDSKVIFGDYEKEIISIRNKFAHAILLKDENDREYFKHGESGLTFDEELCKKIRQNILKHRKNFIETISKLNSGTFV